MFSRNHKMCGYWGMGAGRSGVWCHQAICLMETGENSADRKMSEYTLTWNTSGLSLFALYTAVNW